MGLKFDVPVPGGEGEMREVDLDLSLGDLTLRESLRLQDAIGIETFDKLMEGKRVLRDLHIIEALIWCKLYTEVPGIGIEDFDLPLEALSILQKDEDIEMPMETPDGETVTAEVGDGETKND